MKISQKKPLSSGGHNIGVKELLDLIPPSLHAQLVKELDLDVGVKKLKSKILFELIIYSLFSPIRISLRRMAEHAISHRFTFYSNAALDHVAHTSIRSSLLRTSSQYFEKLYRHLYGKLREDYSSSSLLKKYNLKRYDSTMVAVFAHLLKGMKVGNSSKNKRQVKFTTELTGDSLIYMRFFKDQKDLSEDVALRKVIEERQHGRHDIVVFDAGLKKRTVFQEFDLKGINFVTRLNTNPLFKLCHQTPQNFEAVDPALKEELPKTAPIVGDYIVHLAQDGANWLEHPFRLIQVDIGEEHPLSILTNITHLEPAIIAAFYLLRWEIEVFFRFIKQEMDVKHLVSHDSNAILIMMYCTMIAAMLILVYKRKNNISSYKKAKISFLDQLEKICLLALLEDDVGLQFFKERLKEDIIK